MHKVFHRVMWKQAKRRQRRKKRACFEERPRFSAPFGAGNRLAGRCFCGEALPEAGKATRFRGSGGDLGLVRGRNHQCRNGVLQAKRRRWRKKRACFEERPRFSAPFGGGNRLAGRCFCGEALPEADKATRFGGIARSAASGGGSERISRKRRDWRA